jgi:hypothetical protein
MWTGQHTAVTGNRMKSKKGNHRAEKKKTASKRQCLSHHTHTIPLFTKRRQHSPHRLHQSESELIRRVKKKANRRKR